MYFLYLNTRISIHDTRYTMISCIVYKALIPDTSASRALPCRTRSVTWSCLIAERLRPHSCFQRASRVCSRLMSRRPPVARFSNTFSRWLTNRILASRLKSGLSSFRATHCGLWATRSEARSPQCSCRSWHKKSGSTRMTTHLITMGSPRVGNWDFARRLEFHFPNIYRLEHHCDMVLNVPPQMNLWGPHLKTLTSYVLLPSELHSSMTLDKPFHAGIVIYYDNNMENAEEYKICAQEDAKECSVFLHTSVQDHLMYFHTQVS